jgi:hypothetical protein
MQIRSSVAACLAVGMIACDAGSHGGPYQPVAPVAPTSFQHFGIVHDSRGNPIAGADVSYWPEIGTKEFSDETGHFELPGYFEEVYASKPGYESAIADASNDIQLTLHEIIRIPAGQSARVTVGPGDSIGGPALRYRVRTIRVFSNGDRIVGLQLLADDNGPVDYRLPQLCGDLCAPNSPTTFLIEGGGERKVDIVVPKESTVSRTFTLITSAQDP